MYMVMFVLDDTSYLDELLAAWTEAGIAGATIVESTGLHRRRIQDIHMRFLYQAASSMVEEGHVTLFTIVPDEERVQACLRATEALMGDLSEPNTGVFATWPLTLVKGLPKNHRGRDS